jgi:hypothetical protein
VRFDLEQRDVCSECRNDNSKVRLQVCCHVLQRVPAELHGLNGNCPVAADAIARILQRTRVLHYGR